MLGAITGRAEAQVMRLSALYALLDKSPLIQPQHHRAAMALWDYCERSSQWIFGTNTGDKHADKIMDALHRAGDSGMTRTDISEQAFNRNLTSGVLGDALRMLDQSGYAYHVNENTAGAPAERWFAGRRATN